MHMQRCRSLSGVHHTLPVLTQAGAQVNRTLWMGLRPWFKSQLKCPVAPGPGVTLGPHPQGVLQNKGDGPGGP